MTGNVELGRRVRKRRRELDITQAELAAATGIPQYHISAIETGRIGDIKGSTAWKLAQALKTTTDDLLQYQVEPHRVKRRGVPAEV
jgi:transcriptional regulator with XRE-family HTH domain